MVGVVQTFEDSEAFRNPHHFESEKLTKKSTPLKSYPLAGKQTSNNFATESNKVFRFAKEEKNMEKKTRVTGMFFQLRRYHLNLSVNSKVCHDFCWMHCSESQKNDRQNKTNLWYYHMYVLRLLVIDMSFLSTSLRLTYHQLVHWICYQVDSIDSGRLDWLNFHDLIRFDSVWRRESLWWWTLFDESFVHRKPVEHHHFQREKKPFLATWQGKIGNFRSQILRTEPGDVPFLQFHCEFKPSHIG